MEELLFLLRSFLREQLQQAKHTTWPKPSDASPCTEATFCDVNEVPIC